MEDNLILFLYFMHFATLDLHNLYFGSYDVVVVVGCYFDGFGDSGVAEKVVIVVVLVELLALVVVE